MVHFVLFLPPGEPNAKMNRYDNEDNENEQLETEIFDTVLCTVPLGILKVRISVSLERK